MNVWNEMFFFFSKLVRLQKYECPLGGALGHKLNRWVGVFKVFKACSHTHTQTFCEGGWRNQKELYCQVCLHTQGICLGVRNFQYKKVQTV